MMLANHHGSILRVLSYLVAVVALQIGAHGALAGRVDTDLSGPGWRLWRDTQAKWREDELFLPPVDLAKLPVNPPTGGWVVLDANAGVAAAVPGTAEEYLGDGTGTKVDLKGVQWWYRTLEMPQDLTGRRVLLRFESCRQRSEVYIDGQLAGYDLIGNTPFEADVTRFAKPGARQQLALRITHPGGNWDWIDTGSYKWGKYTFPMSHHFSGITGRVSMLVVDRAYIDDLWIQNTPAMRDINVLATLRNTGDEPIRREVTAVVRDLAGKEVARKALGTQELKLGDTPVRTTISVADAKLWDLDSPTLYTCELSLGTEDSATRRFGFRWFGPEGVGQEATLRLNGKRIVLRTAISWGFWPINGMYPTPEMARRQVSAAKLLGLNMLNFHRCIGSPVGFEAADEMGLLYFEEPGAYVGAGKDPFAQAVAREKLLRMARRDRSHPSLVIYNMINEQWDQYGADKDDVLFAVHMSDMLAAHAIDPTRIMTYTSAWAYAINQEQRVKLHMRPFEMKPYFIGWQDFHRAPGPETWHQGDYQDPAHSYGTFYKNAKEIVYWGEEGAVSTPPRLGKIKAELDAGKRLGWDGQVYLDWYKAFDQFLNQKSLRGSFKTVDDLCLAMGAVSHEHQGRKIQLTRICDTNDGYAVNGWEAELVENHSGIVDCFRNPKADPAILAHYNQPLYVAVLPRTQILQTPDTLVVDFFAVNEKDLRGPHTLRITAADPNGKQAFATDIPVNVSGGDVYGQLLAEAVKIPINVAGGMWKITAALVDPAGQTRATGSDEVLAVDWRSMPITGQGAVWETGSRVRDFLKNGKGIEVPAYRDDLGKLDWVVVARSLKAEPDLIAAGALSGLTATFYKGNDFKEEIARRTDTQIRMELQGGATPDAKVPQTENYCIRWEGTLTPPKTGLYDLVAGADDGVRVYLDGKLVIDNWRDQGYHEERAEVPLEAGKSVALRVDYFQAGGDAKCMLKWAVPSGDTTPPEGLFERARRDGTTILLIDRADTWLGLLEKQTSMRQNGVFGVGTNWLGGQFFVRKHPLFADLPVDVALNWPYQRLVQGSNRFGVRMEGEELVVGAYQTTPFDLGTSVGVLPCGKGKVVFSALEIANSLNDPANPAHVGRKLLCNYLRYAAQSQQR